VRYPDFVPNVGNAVQATCV